LWKKLSPEAKNFVDNLLNKDPYKRMTIKEVMEHPWLQKYNKNSNTFIKRKKSGDFSQFETYTNINTNMSSK
jgi:serine/threonine protein kinase